MSRRDAQKLSQDEGLFKRIESHVGVYDCEIGDSALFYCIDPRHDYENDHETVVRLIQNSLRSN